MSRLSAERIRSFKRGSARPMALLTLALTLSVAHGQGLPAPSPFVLDQELRDMLLQQQQDLASGKRQVPGLDAEWLQKAKSGLDRATESQQRIAREIGQQSLAKAGVAAAAPKAQIFDTLIFVSYSMPEAELMEVLHSASRQPQTLVVMRGVPQGQSIPLGLLQMQRLASRLDPVPNITLDPTAFSRYAVTAVPTIVALTKEQAAQRALVPMKELPANEAEAKGLLQQATEQANEERLNASEAQVLARVQGLSNPQWLWDQIEAGRTGDLGVRGPTLAIAEPDLIEVMKERVAKIDWDAKRHAAINNFWAGQRYIELDRAFLPRTRRIDATVLATGDIKTSTGEFVARAGDRVNPLQTRPFTQAIVVFDARDDKQVQTVLEQLPDIRMQPGVQRIVLISTALDRDEGWDGYKRITSRFDAPVFLLTPDVRDRFALEKVPSVITADSTHFIVREIPVIDEHEQTPDLLAVAGERQ